MFYAYFLKDSQSLRSWFRWHSKVTLARCLAWIPLAAIVLYAPPSSGHGVGQTMEQEVGDYLVDIGVDTVEILEEQDAVFDMALVEHAGTLQWEYAPYDTVWVMMSQEGKEPLRTILSVKNPAPILLTHRFDDPGDVRLAVRFLQDGEEKLADASFTLNVHSKDESGGKGIALALFALFLMGVIGVVWYRRNETAQPASLQRPKTSKTKKRH